MRDIEFGVQNGSWFHAPSYQELVDSMEYREMLAVHDDDYQGDSYYLLQDEGRFGVLVFGWGSCSGCDALEGAESVAEVIELRDGLVSSIDWFDSRDELVAWLSSEDRDGQFWMYRSEGRDFLAQALHLVGADISMVRNRAIAGREV